MKNYFNQMMHEGYALLVSDEVDWPYELDDAQKINLLQLAINYFQELEEYERCAALRDKIELVKNPLKRRGRPKGSKNKK
jgi:protein-arginine kinase activator protein McsA